MSKIVYDNELKIFSVYDDNDQRVFGFVSSITSGAKITGKAIASGAKVAGKAIVSGAKATGHGLAIAGKAIGTGAVNTGKALVKAPGAIVKTGKTLVAGGVGTVTGTLVARNRARAKLAARGIKPGDPGYASAMREATLAGGTLGAAGGLAVGHYGQKGIAKGKELLANAKYKSQLKKSWHDAGMSTHDQAEKIKELTAQGKWK